MRLDLDHVRTLARAFSIDESGEKFLKVDLQAMRAATERLSLWEAQAIARSAVAKKLTIEQRVILALFAHREGDK